MESRHIQIGQNKLSANMTTSQFCHWLYGFLTLENPEFISAAQTQVIKDHLALVFNKVTPNYTKEDKKPDYFIGYPDQIPMFDQYDENGKPKPRLIC